MKMLFIALLVCLVALLHAPTQADRAFFNEPNWSLEDALGAAAEVDVDMQLMPLFRLAREGEGPALHEALSAIGSRTEWPWPAREKILHAFAVGLADLDPGSVGPAVLQHLESFEPKTWVPHEEDPRIGVPLFNIRAAMTGVRVLWQKQDAAVRSQDLLEDGVGSWLDAYSRSGSFQRQGLLDGLADVDKETLMGLAEAALGHLPADATLTEVVVRSGLLLEDPMVFSKALAIGSGPGLVQALRAASKRFSGHQNLAILDYSIKHAPASSAALAMAELAPARLAEPDVADLMFETLEHHELGSAAALVLASSRERAIIQRLSQRSTQDESLAARRAAMAMDMSRVVQAEDER